jgi:hypothetical protein
LVSEAAQQLEVDSGRPVLSAARRAAVKKGRMRRDLMR